MTAYLMNSQAIKRHMQMTRMAATTVGATMVMRVLVSLKSFGSSIGWGSGSNGSYSSPFSLCCLCLNEILITSEKSLDVYNRCGCKEDPNISSMFLHQKSFLNFFPLILPHKIKSKKSVDETHKQ